MTATTTTYRSKLSSMFLSTGLAWLSIAAAYVPAAASEVTSATGCGASLLVESDSDQNGWIDEEEYQRLLVSVSPAECDITSVYTSSNFNVDNPDDNIMEKKLTYRHDIGGDGVAVLNRAWEVVTCLCQQFDDINNVDIVVNNNRSANCCDASNPQLLLAGVDYPEPVYSDSVCEIIDEAVSNVCNDIVSNPQTPGTLEYLFRSTETTSITATKHNATEANDSMPSSDEEAVDSDDYISYVEMWKDPKTIASVAALLFVILIFVLVCKTCPGNECEDADREEEKVHSATAAVLEPSEDDDDSVTERLHELEASKRGMIYIPRNSRKVTGSQNRDLENSFTETDTALTGSGHDNTLASA